MNPIEWLREAFASKAQAYRHVFDPKTRAGQIVLADLAEFCRANDSTFHTDARLEGILQGRREVWLRIQNYSRLDADDLIALRAAQLEAKKSPGG